MTDHALTAPSSTPQPGGKALQKTLLTLGPLLAVIILSLFFEFTTRSFLSIGNLTSILEAAAIPVILSVAISFVIICGAIDLSGEGVIASSSMILSLLVLNSVNGNDFGLLGVAAALGLGLVVGLGNGFSTPC